MATGASPDNYEEKKVHGREGSLPLSVVLILVLHLRPYVFITVRNHGRLFVHGPQIAEGIVLRFFPDQLPVIAAPCCMPAPGITAAVPCRNPFTSYHSSSSPSTRC